MDTGTDAHGYDSFLTVGAPLVVLIINAADQEYTLTKLVPPGAPLYRMDGHGVTDQQTFIDRARDNWPVHDVVWNMDAFNDELDGALAAIDSSHIFLVLENAHELMNSDLNVFYHVLASVTLTNLDLTRRRIYRFIILLVFGEGAMFPPVDEAIAHYNRGRPYTLPPR